jgi:hypothetical protein
MSGGAGGGWASTSPDRLDLQSSRDRSEGRLGGHFRATSDPSCAPAAADPDLVLNVLPDEVEDEDEVEVEVEDDVAVSLALTLQLVEALIDDVPESTELLVEAAGDLLVTLRLASLVVGLLEGDTPDEKRKSLAALSLALQMVEVG